MEQITYFAGGMLLGTVFWYVVERWWDRNKQKLADSSSS